MRINKYISETGFCSRREVDKLIEARRVTINGKLATLGSQVGEQDEVRIDNKLVQQKPKKVYVVLNKPVGITSTTEKKIDGNIVDFVGHDERIFPIGRLDKDSEGLILLTNDGDIVNKILRAENHHEKEYIVTVDRPITPNFLERMAKGVKILDTVTLPCKVEFIAKNVFKIVLTQGLNRQIRRMCEALGYKVRRLQRIRIMNIHLHRLKVGEWRELTHKERTELFNLLNYRP